MTGTKPRGRPRHPDVLTPAEWRVVDSVRHGLTNPAIARRLGVSVDAVKFHVANALSKLGFESRADLSKWPGIRRGSPMHGKTPPMTDQDQLRGLAQVARTVVDLDRAVQFYRDRLGLSPLGRFGSLAFFDMGGVRLYLQQGEDGAGGNESILYFGVRDIHAAHRDLEAAGISFRAAPHLVHRHEDGSEEWMAFFDDDEGRPLALASTVAD